MKKWLPVLFSFLLCASVGMNVYLWLSLKEYNNQDYKREQAYENTLGSTSASHTELDGTAQYERPYTGVKMSEEAVNISPKSPVSNGQHYDINELNTMLEKSDYASLSATLSQLLKASPFDEHLLLLEGELIRFTKPLATALIHYYDLSDLPLTPAALTKIQTNIATLYQHAQNQLRQDEQWELIAKLNEPLLQRIPEARHYILNLAEAYAYQKKITLMEDTLAALPFNDSAAETIRAIAYQQQEVAQNKDDVIIHNDIRNPNKTRVSLERIGDQYRVNAKALNQKATMILDTGASTTAISSRLFARLGRMRALTFIGNFNVQTASGAIEAPLVKIPRFYFAGYEFSDVSAIVLPEEALPDADGLLGMNILGEFDFSISPQSNSLILTERN